MTQHTKQVIAHRAAINYERKTHFKIVLWFACGVLLLSMAASWGWAVTDDTVLHVPTHPTYQQLRHACIDGLVTC